MAATCTVEHGDDKFGKLLSSIDSLPSIPWEGGSTPADDKRELGERCPF